MTNTQNEMRRDDIDLGSGLLDEGLPPAWQLAAELERVKGEGAVA